MARTDYGAILSTVIKDTSDSIREVNETSALIAPNEWGGLIRAMHSDSEYQSALAGLQKKTIENVPIASFNALSGVKLDSLKVLVEAQQDLHGYDKPWAGGGGKNKCNAQIRASSLANGITSQVYADNRITASGQSSGNGDIGINLDTDLVLDSGKTYTISLTGTVTRTSALPVYLRVKGGSYTSPISMPVGSNYMNISNTSGTFDRILIRVTNTQTITMDAKIQVEEGSSPTSYAPYENICPITGWSGANVTRTGKNVWGGEALLQSFIGANITGFVYDTTAKTLTYYASAMTGKNILSNFKFKENTQYTLILRGSNALNYNATNLRVWYSDGTNSLVNFPQAQANVKQTCVFTSSSGKTIDRIAGVNASGTVTLYYDECGLFEGVVTASDFEPFIGNQYSIWFSGVLNGTYGFVNLGDLNWTYDSTNTRFYAKPTGMATNKPFICTKYPYVGGYAQAVDKSCFNIYNTQVGIKDSAFTDAQTFTNAMDGVYLIYELATPTTPTITQAQMDTLVKAFGVEKMSAIFVFGDTYYGGELDVTNGVLRVTKAIVNLGSLSWNTPANRSTYYGLANIIKAPINAGVLCGAIAEKYHEVPSNSSLTTDGQFAVGTNGYLYFYRVTDTPTGMFVYPLATPFTIQLTAQQIEQLEENNIWADTGDVSECVYYASGSEPQYDITQICDNSSYSSTLTLTDSYSNYDFLKIVIYNSDDSKDYTIFTIPSVLDQIATYGNNLVNFNTVMETNIYCAYTMTSSSTWTRYGNRNSNIKAIYGYKATNKTVSVTPIYARQNITTSSVTPTSTTSLYDYDIIFLATCSGAVDETQPCNNVIYPKGKFNGIPHYFILNKYLGATCVAMTEFTLGANSNYFGVYGIKFE